MSKTIIQSLSWAKEKLKNVQYAPADLESEILLAHILNIDRLRLFEKANNKLTPFQFKKYTNLIKERLKHKPISYITHKKEFMSLDFEVSPDVLIPRPETELLTESVINEVKRRNISSPKIFEIGTGSGAIAVSLAKYLDKADIIASDISKKALKLAQKNSNIHNVSYKIKFIQGDLFEPVKEKLNYFDAVVSNPPYISNAEVDKLDETVKKFEPLTALKSGETGLEFIWKIILKGKDYLKTGGFLALEIGEGQSHKARKLVESILQYRLIDIFKDYNGIRRIVVAEKL